MAPIKRKPSSSAYQKTDARSLKRKRTVEDNQTLQTRVIEFVRLLPPYAATDCKLTGRKGRQSGRYQLIRRPATISYHCYRSRSITFQDSHRDPNKSHTACTQGQGYLRRGENWQWENIGISCSSLGESL